MSERAVYPRRTPQRSRAVSSPEITPKSKRNRLSFLATLDMPLLLIVGLLLAIGAGMVYSTTFDWSLEKYGTNYGIFVNEHVRNMGMGLVGLLILSVIDYRFWRRFAVWLLLITIAALVAVLLFGDDTFGARRALIQGRFQPGELAEFTIVIYLAAWLGARNTRVGSITMGLIPFGLVVAIIAGLVAAQPDLSSAAIIASTAGIMYFVAGAKWEHLAGTAFIALIAGLILVQTQTYARPRVESYIAGLTDLTQTNYHTQQAIIAFVNGGWTGVGLGQSQQKFNNALPAPHTDSIFAIIGEELGVLGASVVILLYIAFIVRGFQIARRAVDPFGSLLVIGFTLWVAIQALLNIAVMTAIVPSSGLPLPFISYGGSSLLVLMSGVGLILSVQRISTQRENTAVRRQDGAHYAGRGRDGRTRVPGTRRRRSVDRTE